MKCRLCGKETQKIKGMGGIARRYDPRKYCKECYEKLISKGQYKEAMNDEIY